MTSANMPKGLGGEKFKASRLNANVCGVNGGKALSGGSINADPRIFPYILDPRRPVGVVRGGRMTWGTRVAQRTTDRDPVRHTITSLKFVSESCCVSLAFRFSEFYKYKTPSNVVSPYSSDARMSTG